MNFFRNVELINKVNLTGQIEPIRDELIDDIILSRSNRREGSYNFEVNTKHNKYLYDLFIERSKRLLNKFTLKDTDFHFHIEFYPPLRHGDKPKILAGSESMAGVFIMDVLPEESAKILRAHMQ